MKKSTLFEIILANIGGMFVATGLFMIFISSWNLRTAGIVSTEKSKYFVNVLSPPLYLFFPLCFIVTVP